MDCIDLFKKAGAAMQTDPRYLELDSARRANDAAGELLYQSPVPESWADDFGITDPDSPSARYTPA